MTDEEKLKALCQCMGWRSEIHYDDRQVCPVILHSPTLVTMRDRHRTQKWSYFYYDTPDDALKALLELSDRENKARVV